MRRRQRPTAVLSPRRRFGLVLRGRRDRARPGRPCLRDPVPRASGAVPRAAGEHCRRARRRFAAVLPDWIGDRDVAFLGHSFGSVVAFEVALRLRLRGLQPVRLFASCRRAPSTVREDPLTSRPEMEAWARHTVADAAVHEFPGGHFFISEQMTDVIALIRNELVHQLVQPLQNGE